MPGPDDLFANDVGVSPELAKELELLARRDAILQERHGGYQGPGGGAAPSGFAGPPTKPLGAQYHPQRVPDYPDGDPYNSYPMASPYSRASFSTEEQDLLERRDALIDQRGDQDKRDRMRLAALAAAATHPAVGPAALFQLLTSK